MEKPRRRILSLDLSASFELLTAGHDTVGLTEEVNPGDEVRVRIIKISKGEKAGQKKISLSMKQVSQNPWETVNDRFQVGAKVQGKVTRCMKFGAFVEILPGTDGLIHISQLDNERVNKVTDILKEGDEVLVKVIDVDKNGRIALSRKAAFGESLDNAS